MTVAVVPTAQWDLHRLVSSLSSHGWGELDGPENAGLQKVLNALTALLPWEAAEGRLTRAQVADAASMTPKWAGHCLARLEAMGLISWRRGWMDRGKPRPGWIRVNKTRLAAMVRAVRGYLDARKARRRAETHHRLATTLRRTTVPPWKLHKRLSSRGELSSTLPTPKGRTARGASDPPPSQTLPGIDGDLMPACAVCGKAEDACSLAARKVPQALRHAFEPGRTYVPTLVSPTHELHPSPEKRASSGWRSLVPQPSTPTHPTLEGLDQ